MERTNVQSKLASLTGYSVVPSALTKNCSQTLIYDHLEEGSLIASGYQDIEYSMPVAFKAVRDGFGRIFGGLLRGGPE